MRTLVEGSSSPPSYHSSSGNIESHDDDAVHVPQNQRTPPPRAKLRYKPKHRIALLTRLYIRQRLFFSRSPSKDCMRLAKSIHRRSLAFQFVAETKTLVVCIYYMHSVGGEGGS